MDQMTTNRTSEAVEELQEADVYDSFPNEKMIAICKKYKRMEEALESIKNNPDIPGGKELQGGMPQTYWTAIDALSFDPI